MNKRNKLIGALWNRKDKKGKKYMTGLILEEKIIVFSIDKKINGPDLLVYRNEED